MVVSVVVLGLGAVLSGCRGGEDPSFDEPLTFPVEAFRGPTWLRGTVGSMASLRNGEPMLVSGYGLMVNLEGTGSSEVPSFIRTYLINEMRKRGMPNPEQVLFDRDTAVVALEGLIPAGVSRGERFDVLVSAVDSQTISLEGGDVWTVDLAPGPLDPNLRYVAPVAEASGAVFVEPSDEVELEGEVTARRQALLVAGGRVTADRVLELVLFQPSWQRSRLIADRINERFPKAPSDRLDTARPMSDSLIRVRVPGYWQNQPERFLEQALLLYTQRGSGFDERTTLALAERLAGHPEDERLIVAAWQALGRGVLPALRGLYDHENELVRLSALEAGAGLDDGRAARFLSEAIAGADSSTKLSVARSLSLLGENLEAGRALRRLLNDPDELVRVAAYEAMTLAGDPVIDRIPVFGERGLKMLIDQVPAERPLVYVTFDQVPRVVYFGGPIPVPPGALARVWNGRLMVKVEGGGPMAVLYQGRGVRSRTLEMSPNLTELTYVLAHQPTLDRPQEGFDLSYGQTVDAVYELRAAGIFESDFRLRRSPLSELIEQMRGSAEGRPRTASGDGGGGGIVDSSRVAGR
ncbi:MAG: flagellar basal body P-ring protein FlgI [Phycisphaeraceae bacterium]